MASSASKNGPLCNYKNKTQAVSGGIVHLISFFNLTATILEPHEKEIVNKDRNTIIEQGKTIKTIGYKLGSRKTG